MLIHYKPMFPFYTPCKKQNSVLYPLKISEVSWWFSGVLKRSISMQRSFNVISKSNRNWNHSTMCTKKFRANINQVFLCLTENFLKKKHLRYHWGSSLMAAFFVPTYYTSTMCFGYSFCDMRWYSHICLFLKYALTISDNNESDCAF